MSVCVTPQVPTRCQSPIHAPFPPPPAAYSVPLNLPDRWLLCLEVICGAMGVSQPLDDDRLDAFAAAVSPGPALALAFCEALTMGAASVGLPWSLARKMAAQTVRARCWRCEARQARLGE